MVMLLLWSVLDTKTVRILACGALVKHKALTGTGNVGSFPRKNRQVNSRQPAFRNATKGLTSILNGTIRQGIPR